MHCIYLSAAASLHGQLHIIRWERLPPANKQTPADEHAKASKETELLFRSLNFDSNLRFTHHILTTLAKLNTSLRLQLFTRHIPAIRQSHHLCGPMQKIPPFIRRILISFVKLNTCKISTIHLIFLHQILQTKECKKPLIDLHEGLHIWSIVAWMQERLVVVGQPAGIKLQNVELV
jgi:hypothetical protein